MYYINTFNATDCLTSRLTKILDVKKSERELIVSPNKLFLDHSPVNMKLASVPITRTKGKKLISQLLEFPKVYIRPPYTKQLT